MKRLTAPGKPLVISLHIVVWIFLVFLGTSFFSGFWPWQTALLRSILNCLLFGILFYANTGFLFPRYFAKGSYVSYALLVLALGALLFVARVLLKEHLYGPTQVPALSRPYIANFFILVTLVFVWFTSTLYMLLAERRKQKEYQRLINQQRVEAELNFLKAQINPHFLFNTLNNLYSLAFRQDSRTADGLMALSRMMRYLLHESDQESVPLSREIEFLTNFLHLQRLRSSDNPIISWTFPDPAPSIQIAPLILLPFVENAFKHGSRDPEQLGEVSIRLTVEGNDLRFTCRNTTGPHDPSLPHSGKGLENVRQRLELIYGGNHSLNILEEPGRYSVTLSILIP